MIDLKAALDSVQYNGNGSILPIGNQQQDPQNQTGANQQGNQGILASILQKIGMSSSGGIPMA